jgi:DNA-binding Lrp family transcriptional regulator
MPERIVNVMWRYPTASYREIGKAVGLSGAQVHLLTKKLKADGVVTIQPCSECSRPVYVVAEPT